MSIRPLIVLILLALLLLGQPQQSGAQAHWDQQDLVIIAIDEAIKSLKEKPNQFRLVPRLIPTDTDITLHVPEIVTQEVQEWCRVGCQWTGLVTTDAIAGVPWDLQYKAADEALSKQAEKAVQILTEIKGALMQPKPDQGTVLPKLNELASTVIPPIGEAMLDTLVRTRLGL